MRKKKLCMTALGLTVLVMSACGQKESGADGSASDGAESGGGTVSEQHAEEADARREPPDIVFYPLSGEGDSLTVQACGYDWSWPEGADQMGAAIADSAHPLSEGAPWDTLTLSENGDGFSDYSLTIEVNPDELGINMWNLEEIGNSGAPGIQTGVFQREEIAAADFSIPLQAGKIYEIYVKWEKDNVGENGGFGIAYYVFKTSCPVSEETGDDALTRKVSEEQGYPEAVFGEVDTEETADVEGITMTVTKAGPEGACLEILNQTDKELTLGDDYELQVWQNGDWYQVDYIIDNAAFHMVGYIFRKDEPQQMDVNWTYFHGILPAGRYRITKTADVEDMDGSVKYRLGAEFTLE